MSDAVVSAPELDRVPVASPANDTDGAAPVDEAAGGSNPSADDAANSGGASEEAGTTTPRRGWWQRTFGA